MTSARDCARGSADGSVHGSVHGSALGDEAFYESLCEQSRHLAVAHPDLHARLHALTDVLWTALASRGCSWVGFYLHAGATDPSSLLLIARQPKPACSPIELHGVCGQAFLEEHIRLVEDVELLGTQYVACDPRDRSELVVPIFTDGNCIGVLDLDSFETCCFTEADALGISKILRAADLLDRPLKVRADCLPKA